MPSDIHRQRPVSRPSPSRRFPSVVWGLILGGIFAFIGFLASPNSVAPAAAQAAETLCVGVQRDVSVPLTDLGPSPYMRMDGQVTEFSGGLYPGGSNTRPPEMEAAGQAIAAQIVPLNADGLPDPVDGRIVMISLGMSNTQMEFQTFMDDAHQDARLNPSLTLVSGALGGQTADRWVDPAAQAWLELDARLNHARVTPLQVQVAWIKQTLTRGGDFPGKALELQADLEIIVQQLQERFPNLRIVFLSSRTRSFLYDRGLSPEPAAFETGFAVKWLIEAQLAGDPDLNYDASRGPVRAPFLAWGPYLWIDGLNPRSDGMTWMPADLAEDCTHPSSSGVEKVSQMLMAFFTTDSLAAPWFLARAEHPTSLPSTSTAAPSSTAGRPPTERPLTPTSPPMQTQAVTREAAVPVPPRTGISLGIAAGVLAIGIGAAAFVLRARG